MKVLKINNYIINTPLIDILYDLKRILTNGKLRDIKIHADDIVVTCPHHANGMEVNPDCNIYVGDDPNIPYGFARCFACEFQGYFEKFVAECFNSSIEYAKNWLIQHYGTLSYNVLDIDAPIEFGTVESKTILSANILDSYQHYCPYLTKRKLSRETCELFNVRYDPKYRQVIFPVYDSKDRFVMAVRRNIDTKTFYMDKGVEKEVYCLNYIIKNNIKQFMIVEGPIDALTCWENHVPAVACLGAISDYQINQINKSCPNVVFIATDNDDAGRRFALLLQEKLNKSIITVYVQLPKGRKDVNDLTLEEWQMLINKYSLPINIY